MSTIANFGADDTLILTGVPTSAVEIEVRNGDTVFEISDGAGTISRVTLADVSGFFTDVESFNAANVGDIVFA